MLGVRYDFLTDIKEFGYKMMKIKKNIRNNGKTYKTNKMKIINEERRINDRQHKSIKL